MGEASQGTQVVYAISDDVVMHSVEYSVHEVTLGTQVTTADTAEMVVILDSVHDSVATFSTTVSYSVVTQDVTGQLVVTQLVD